MEFAIKACEGVHMLNHDKFDNPNTDTVLQPIDGLLFSFNKETKIGKFVLGLFKILFLGYIENLGILKFEDVLGFF